MQIQQLYAEITARIMEGLAQGVKPWRCEWNREVPLALPRNALTGQVYRGTNVVWLWMCREDRGFSQHQWLTYRQAQTLVAQQAGASGVEVVKHSSRGGGTYYTDPSGQPLGGVRKGAKAVHCIKLVIKDDEADSEVETARRMIPCPFSVFNLDQVEGIENREESPTEATTEAAERFVARATAPGEIGFHEEGVRAYYSLREDALVMPARDRFVDRNAYLGTFFHELGHASGAGHRLGRIFGERSSPQYAAEELVAELCACFLGAQFGVQGDYANHESYISSWLDLLNADKTAIVHAARLAEDAVTFLLDRYGEKEP
jgi:antirestriction protein ArdC